MTTKTYRFKLNSKLAKPFIRDGKYSFQVSFNRYLENGGLRVINYRKCPILTIPGNGIVQTSNEIAVLMIAGMIVPDKTKRNGKSRESGRFFSDVTDTKKDFDLNLDPIFDNVQV